MPWAELTLLAGVDAEKTPTLLQAQYSQSQLIRFRDGLAQKYGGWSAYPSPAGPLTATGIVRELRAWQDLNNNKHLAIGTPSQLAVITNGVLTDITPQILVSSSVTLSASAPILSSTVGGVTTTYISFLAVDSAIGPQYNNGFSATASALTGGIDAVYINTPIAIGGFIFSGWYQAANLSVSGGNGYWNLSIIVPSGTTESLATATMPVFATRSGNSLVKVTLANHGLIAGETISFDAPTTGNGVTISGVYVVQSGGGAYVQTNTFFIVASTPANATGSFNMNGGNASYTYSLATGYSPGNEQTGTNVNVTGWSFDNWGQILLACQENGPVFQWTPGSTVSANPVGTAPGINGGIFVSNAQQVLICYNTSGQPNLSQNGFVGCFQEPLAVAWSTVGDYTNFQAEATNQAGAFVIPSGSVCVGGMAVANQNFIWTDLDLWAMTYIGYPLVYSFNKIGAGAGLISRDAAQQLRGNIYWMGPSNFFAYAGSGVQVIPCPVWDVVFQNLNQAYVKNIRAMPNTPFNEVGWLYPSAASESGECDSYVKFNIVENNAPWDYGTMSRSAWIDQSILGNPIGGDVAGNIWQHESTNDAGGGPMVSSFTTGYFYIAEGEDFAFVDQIIPDMRWGFFSQAQTASVQVTINGINFPGDTPITYGPYTMTNTTKYISTRLRHRQLSVTVQSSDAGSFWRLGKIRFRFDASGRI